ncbi:cell wall hydrolase [Brevundimonas sp. Marseille-Q4549]
MTLTRWTLVWRTLKRSAAALPAVGAVLGVALAAGSTERPDIDRTAEAVARITGGDLGGKGLSALEARLSPSQLALAQRHDPRLLQPALYGLTPGWESLTLAGKPSLDLGKTGLEAQRLNAAVPTAVGALRPALPFVFKGGAEDRRRAVRCLTQAVYFEAALEPDAGQAAVAQVVLNRVRDPNYADTVCGVVFEGAERTTGCQFSFTCDGSLAQTPVPWAWDRARKVAERALNGAVAQQVGTATHYHADYVHPWWAPTVAKVTQIGAHIFYRWKGFAGETAAFRNAYGGHEPAIDEARFAKARLPALQAGQATGGADPNAVGSGAPMKTVEIDGHQRVVGVVSLGGRRLPTREEVAAINARLSTMEAPKPAAQPAPEGVTPMEVEEVGRPAR